MASYTYHGNGVKSKVRAKDGKRVYFVEVYWKGKRRTHKGGTTAKKATATLGTLQAQIDNGTYIPSTERKRAERRAAASREGLRFETAAARFLTDCGRDYAQPAGVKGALHRLGIAFAGRYLDELTRADVETYTRQRLHREGPFKTWTRCTGLRGPQAELGTLSQVYRHMQDLGHELANPCLRSGNVGRRRTTKTQTYRPVRVPVIPTAEALRLIFTAKATGKNGHDLIGDAHRVLWILAYYTGGRPESDLLRLRHRDVESPDTKVRGIDGREVLGRVHFRDAKTAAGHRTIPLHPEAAEALAGILDPDADPSAFVFRTKDRSGAVRRWDEHTYRKAWKVTAAAAGLPGMILRDLRKTFRTRLTDARVPEPTIRRLMGHALDVSQGYAELSGAEAERAVLTLTVPGCGLGCGPSGNMRVPVSGGDSESAEISHLQRVTSAS